MTLTQLRYAVALHRTRSFARAAEQCLVSQPSLSQQIQKLEQELGAELFDRTQTPVAATPLGERIVEQARIALRETERVLDLAREEQGEPAGTLSVGIIPTISTYLLPVIFPQLSGAYPGVDFRFYELPTSQITEKLNKDELELGVLATPLRLIGLEETPLYYEPLVVHVPPQYDGKTANLSLADLEQYDLILLGEEHCFRHQSLAVCNQSARSRIECGSMETIKKMVGLGAGLTLLPLLAVDQEHDRIARFAEPEPAREVSLVRRKGFWKNRLLRILRDAILDSVPDELHDRGARKVIGVEAQPA